MKITKYPNIFWIKISETPKYTLKYPYIYEKALFSLWIGLISNQLICQ